MPELVQLQTNFTAGELSPQLKGRTDIDKYFNGAEILENYIVHPHGGASRRPGTRFVAEVKDSSKFTRLIPFQFSTIEAYILEFGDRYIRFYRDNGQIQSGGVPVEIASPYLEADLLDIKFVQSADILFIFHPDHHPKQLERTSHTAWTLNDFDFENGDGPYLDINGDSTHTVTPSATTGTTVAVSSSAALFASTDVGRLIRLEHSGTWGYAKIVAFTSSTGVDVDIIKAFGGTTATSSWRLGAWSETTGWPYLATFYQGRMIFGGTDSNPQTIWTSRSGDFNDFAPSDTDGTVTDSHAITRTIDDDQVNAIRWMSAMPKTLAIGTAAAEYTTNRGQTSKILAPTNFDISRETAWGSRLETTSERISNTLLFVSADGKKVRQMNYTLESDGFLSTDMTLLSEHITQGGVVEHAYQQGPDSVYWAARNDGILLGFTFEPEQNVFAWHRHKIGGNESGLNTIVDSVASIQNGFDYELWMICMRTIDGATKRYVEYMEQPFRGDLDLQEDAFFVDSGLSGTSGTPTDTWAGLDHLEGESVSVLADGATHKNVTVTGGQITLDRDASKIQAGLPYTSRMRTLPIFSDVDGGVIKGKIKRIHRAFVQFHETLGVKMGPDDGSLTTISFRTPSDPMGLAPTLFTGLKKVTPNSGYGRNAQFEIHQDQPLPGTVLSVALEYQVNDW